MKSSSSKNQIKEENSKNNDPKEKNQEEDNSSNNEIAKEKTLERFIYVTTYHDSDFLEKIKLLFEEINQKAFNLSSPKETYTHNLTEEERTQMNSETKMIFADSNILFNERIYSKFDLSLKFIKTRDTLEQILTTFDIYLKSTNYRLIYDAFMNIGSILKSETLKDITDENLFPDADGLLLLERKYGDILKEEDLTGIKKEKVIKKKFLITTNKTFSATKYGKTSRTIFNSNDEDKNNIIKANNPIFKNLVKKALNISLNDNNKDNKDINSSSYRYNKNRVETEPNKNYEQRMLNIAPKILANNTIFNTILKNREKNFGKNLLSHDEYMKKNLEDIKNMKRKGKFEKFWKPDNSEHDPNKKIYFYAIRANHYEEVVNKMREKYLKDKNHFYTYSDYSLALSFPMIDRYRNEEYLKYMENKSKWINKNDFDR